MAFRNPLQSLSADQITPGTLSGSTVETGSSGLRVVLDPSPDSSTGTTDPAALFYSGDPHEQRPGSVSANTWALFGGDGATVMTVRAPDVAGQRQPGLYLYGDAIDLATGVKTGDRSWFFLAADSDVLTDGYATLLGNAGTTGTPGSAKFVLSTRDDTGAGGGAFADLTVDRNGVTIAGTNAKVTTPLVDNGSAGAWTNVTYQTGWTDFDVLAWQRVQVRKLPDGRVHMRGLFKPTAGGVNGTVMNIPAGFRPFGRTQIYPLACQSNVGACFFVYTDGHCEVAQASATTQWLSINAVWDTRS
jgi:hypothetical protein